MNAYQNVMKHLSVSRDTVYDLNPHKQFHA